MVNVEAKARAKPAKAALIFGVMRDTMAVAPTMALERILKRTESHLLTATV